MSIYDDIRTNKIFDDIKNRPCEVDINGAIEAIDAITKHKSCFRVQEYQSLIAETCCSYLLGRLTVDEYEELLCDITGSLNLFKRDMGIRKLSGNDEPREEIQFN